MATARNLILKAMQKAGILTKNEEPAADEVNDALDSMNMMVSGWSTDYMLIYARTLESFTINAGVSSYTIGPGQAFNTVRPIFVNEAYTRDTSNLDMLVDVIDDETYGAINDKTQQGRPYWLNYNNGYPTAIIKIFPTPDQSYTLFLLTEKQLTAFTLDTVIILPPGWEDALVYNLAVRLAPEYGQQADPMTIELAKETKGMIRESILRNRTMDCDPQYSGVPNFRTGYFYGGWY